MKMQGKKAQINAVEKYLKDGKFKFICFGLPQLPQKYTIGLSPIKLQNNVI